MDATDPDRTALDTTLAFAAGTAPAALPGAPELCVVVPVLNEQHNVRPMVERLRAALEGVSWEVVFVDDNSSDDTRGEVAALGREDGRIRLLHRVGRRGLASAFVEGVRCSLAPFVASIDGDLQHDETLLPRMLRVLQTEPVDIVVGSRHVEGGSIGDWGATRAGMSDLATRLSSVVTKASISDPMSGFFMLPRSVFERAAPQVSAIGFKILLDLIASLPTPPAIRELPYRFRQRMSGESKLDVGVLMDFALLLLDKLVGGTVPVRFFLFAAVGAIGLLVHLLVLEVARSAGGLGFETAQGVATAVAIVANFFLNNSFTFRDARLKGPRLWRGLAVFAVACSVGAAANLNVASLMAAAGQRSWWAAGVLGAVMSLVWNYAVGSTLTWRRR